MSNKRPVTFEDVETNVLFMMSLSMDLMLRDLDRKMRQAQREYFKTRNSGWLRLSKDLEKQVDQELKQIDNNPALF